MQQRTGVLARLERPEERLLLAAIAALLVAALTAALLIPGQIHGQVIAREAGSLLAPPSDDLFSDAFGPPLTPTSSIPGSGDSGDPSGGGAPSPDTPGGPAPPVPAPEEPPDDDGILGFLPDLPILPPLPPLPGKAKAHRPDGKGRGVS